VNENRNAPVQIFNLEQDPGEKVDLSKNIPEKAGELGQIMEMARSPNKNFNFSNN